MFSALSIVWERKAASVIYFGKFSLLGASNHSLRLTPEINNVFPSNAFMSPPSRSIFWDFLAPSLSVWHLKTLIWQTLSSSWDFQPRHNFPFLRSISEQSSQLIHNFELPLLARWRWALWTCRWWSWTSRGMWGTSPTSSRRSSSRGTSYRSISTDE